MAVHLKPAVRKEPPMKRINVKRLQETAKQAEFRNSSSGKLSRSLTNFLSHIPAESVDVLGTIVKRNRDWFDEQAENIRELIEEKNMTLQATLEDGSTHLKRPFTQMRARALLELRHMKNAWRSRLARDIQCHADTNNQQEFHSAFKAAYRPVHKASYPVCSEGGYSLITSKEGIQAR